MAYRQTARSEEVRAASRTALLAAARHLFATNGYDATTMQHIVSEADTSIGNAYFYFKNKEQLLFELLSTEARRIWDTTSASVANIPPGPSRIAAIIYTNVTGILTSDADLARLLLGVSNAGSARDEIEKLTVARWVEIFAESAPDLSLVERRRAASMVWGANRNIVGAVVLGETKGTPADIAAFCVRWALRGLCVSEAKIADALVDARRCVARKRKLTR